MKKRSGIYLIQNTTDGKCYVGSSAALHDRRLRHFNELQKNTHYNSHLQRAWLKYGKENFVFTVLEYVPDKKDLVAREQHWIDTTKLSKSLYNTRPATESVLGIRESLETRQMRSLAARKRWDRPEERQRMSRTATTRQSTSEARALMSTSLKKMWGNPEVRVAKLKKMKESLHTRESIQKGLATRKNNPIKRKRFVPVSEEQKVKASVSNKATWSSPEKRKAHSLAMKAQWAKRKAAKLSGVPCNLSPQGQLLMSFDV